MQETKRGISITFLTRYRSGGTPLHQHRTCVPEALRAVARRDQGQPQFWEPPGSTCCPSLLAGGFLTPTLTGSRSSTWVFDTGSVAHICNSKQELKNKRQLLKDEVTMRVGNGSKVNVIAVGTLPLHLPSGLVLSLNNCYYVPALSMNIISGSCLMQDGYSFKSENNGCSIFMNNIFYG